MKNKKSSKVSSMLEGIFEERISIEVRKQEKLDLVKKRNFRREKLLEKYIAKILYRCDDGKFKKEYLKKLERN